MSASTVESREPSVSDWRKALARFQRPSLPRSMGQIASSVPPYLALLAAMYFALDVSWWLALALAVAAAGFLIRIFIIFHDCGHGAFFRSPRANRLVGAFTGFLTFTPSYYWAHQHARHHATSGDLDHRGTGDVKTLTVQEYLALTRWQRLRYRVYRHPVVLFGVGPAYTFFIRHRFWQKGDTPRQRQSTVLTNLSLATVFFAWTLLLGLKTYLLIQLPVMLLAGTFGVWLFYVQHQFEGVYWERSEKWDYLRAAVEGSSFYDLPRWLQWFTGSIGYHHVHHLSPRIPNYNLEKCHHAVPIFRTVRQITLRSSLKSLGHRLWDEDRKRLVGFDYTKVFLGRQAAVSQGVR